MTVSKCNERWGNYSVIRPCKSVYVLGIRSMFWTLRNRHHIEYPFIDGVLNNTIFLRRNNTLSYVGVGGKLRLKETICFQFTRDFLLLLYFRLRLPDRRSEVLTNGHVK